jgi:hypothetical protein
MAESKRREKLILDWKALQPISKDEKLHSAIYPTNTVGFATGP